MATLIDKENNGTLAVKNLRKQRLLNGLPFMINSKEATFLEYPDGSISMVRRDIFGIEFEIIKKLSKAECDKLREKWQLIRLHT
jgi:hypothetical protein